MLFGAAAYGALENAEGFGGRATGVLLVVVASVALLSAVVFAALDPIGRWWRNEVRTVQGLALIDSMPPGLIMERLLHRLYGDHPANDYIARGVIGGAGNTPNTGELSISTSTTVHYALRSEAPGTYQLTQTVDLTFDTGIVDHTLVLFATCDAALRDVLVAGCDRPLLDWLYIHDRSLFVHDDAMLKSVEIGVRYLDADGRRCVVELEAVSPRYVDSSNWSDYLRFFRQDVGSIPFRDHSQYLSTLKIFEVDLADLAEPGSPMGLVTGLTLASASPQSDDGGCFWQAPFPCLVDEITFDVSALVEERGRRLEFLVQSFLPTAAFVGDSKWVPAEELHPLRVDSWALQGHGVALLWRVAENQDGAAQQ